jgi:RNA polymerase sigma-70 factor (ECF subfamily)
VPLTKQDRDLLNRCLAHQPGSWNDFVDQFLGLIYHVIHHTAHLRSATLSPEDVEELAQEVLLQVVAADYNVLRQFKGHSSLSTYLTVIARRICVHELARRTTAREVQPAGEDRMDHVEAGESRRRTRDSENREEVEKMLGKLPTREREVVRLAFLEGRSYEEISTELGIPVNSVGAILARAKKRLRGESVSEPRKETRTKPPGSGMHRSLKSKSPQDG